MRQLPFVSTQRPRAVPIALVALAHLAALFALLYLVAPPAPRGEIAANVYIPLAFIRAPQPRPEPAHARAVAPTAPRVPRQKAQTITLPVLQEVPSPEARASQVAEEPAPRLDIAALRAAARQVDSERKPTAAQQRDAAQLQALDDSALARAVRRAKRPDCQTKYAGGPKADILLLIPLAIETITDKGCKW